MAVSADDASLALYCDFENIALGVRDAKYQKFDISHILERLLLKGSIVVKKAYCDWERYKTFKATMHEAAFELIDIPHVRQSGKNSADIRMVVDALDLCYTKSHVDTFVIISGDSDFSPLVAKLRENAKTVIGVGVKNSTSDLLISSCDEFIYYDDLVREIERKRRSTRKRASKKRASRAREESGARGTEKDADGADSRAGEEVAAEGADGETKGKGRTKKRGGRGRRGASEDASVNGEGRDGLAAAAGDVVADEAAVDELPADDATAEDDTVVGNGGESEGDEIGADEPANGHTPEELAQEGLDLVLETAAAISGERGAEKLWGSMVKQTLKRRRPGFNESYYGFDSFGRMLEEAAARGYLALEHDDRSGGYIITRINV